jgi:hypothetical protein
MATALRTEEIIIVNFDFDGPAKALAFHCCVKLMHFCVSVRGMMVSYSQHQRESQSSLRAA